MPIDLYHLGPSAPCRSVRLCLQALGLEANLTDINVLEGEQMKDEFLEINPQHTIPTIVDDDVTLWESRAILTYLVQKYGESDSLYPSDPKSRALVDRMLYFDMGTLFDRFAKYVMPIFFGNAESLNSDDLAKVHEALGYLNTFLEGQDYAAGDAITVADFALVASVSTMEAADIDFSAHPNVEAWLARCKEHIENYEELNGEGANMFGNMFKEKMASLE